MIDFVAGFLSAWTLRSLLQRKLNRRGGNIGATPLVRNEGRTSPPPPAPERWAIVTVQGLNWPATLGDFTLVDPADNQGAWRWYERQCNGATHRIKVDHQLMPLFPPRPGGLVTYWRILAKALGETSHPDPRIADRIAIVRLVILLSYLTTNTFIVAGVLRHWNHP